LHANLASRIESIAEPDTVAISADSDRLVQGYFVCGDIGLHHLKAGKYPHLAHALEAEASACSYIELAGIAGRASVDCCRGVGDCRENGVAGA